MLQNTFLSKIICIYVAHSSKFQYPHLRPSPFFSFIVEYVFLILGRSVGKRKNKRKNKIVKSCLELGGPVPQHNIRGAWKQQGAVTKST